MALSCDFEALHIFGFGDGKVNLDNDAGDVLYIAYLQMARAGVAALEFWDDKSKKWGQAHMQARFSILRCFLDAGSDFVKLDYKEGKGGAIEKGSLHVKLDRTKILSHGRPAVEAYLQKLHVYKCTADVEAGTKLYEDVTSVQGDFAGKIRDAVLREKVPRKVFVQANTVIGEDGEVELREYDSDVRGMVGSWVERDV